MSAYSIPGDPTTETLTMCCCGPCAVNQMYQTSNILGNPAAQDGGKSFNVNMWNSREKGWCKTGKTFFYGCCMPCGVGTSLEIGIGLPFWLGMCCVNPIAAHHLIRYQYRIKPDSGNDDNICSQIPSIFCFCCPLSCCCFRHMFTVQILRETKLNGNEARPKYLVTKTAYENPMNRNGGEAEVASIPIQKPAAQPHNPRKVIPL